MSLIGQFAIPEQYSSIICGYEIKVTTIGLHGTVVQLVKYGMFFHGKDVRQYNNGISRQNQAKVTYRFVPSRESYLFCLSMSLTLFSGQNGMDKIISYV